LTKLQRINQASHTLFYWLFADENKKSK